MRNDTLMYSISSKKSISMTVPSSTRLFWKNGFCFVGSYCIQCPDSKVCLTPSISPPCASNFSLKWNFGKSNNRNSKRNIMKETSIKAAKKQQQRKTIKETAKGYNKLIVSNKYKDEQSIWLKERPLVYILQTFQSGQVYSKRLSSRWSNGVTWSGRWSGLLSPITLFSWH